MNYITLKKAAEKMKLTYVAVYRAAKRKSLKSVKINEVLHTTEGWINEYKKNWRNKEIVSRFNGRKTFDESLGEMSVKKAAKVLGIKRANLYNLIYAGEIKSIRKGVYHIITHKDIENYVNKVETITTELVI